MNNEFFEIKEGPGLFIATAIHEGSKLRDELHPFINLSKGERLREEDPYTGEWADIAPTVIKGKYSRFEVDLNRPRLKAVYKKPEDAWGLLVWKKDLPDNIIQRSYEFYDAFYKELKNLLNKKLNEFGGVLVYDFHSYNHMREGINKTMADPKQNPEINLGTANINQEKWNDVIVAFKKSLTSFDYMGRKLDVRENIKFKGGYFSQWIYENYPDTSCVIAIEVKKFFMDEWTGKPDLTQVRLLKQAFSQTVSPSLSVFKNILSR